MSYKIDPHIHTSNTSPCGTIAGRRLADLYQQAGYDGIVITDHFCPEFFAGLGRMPWAEKIDRFLAGYRDAAARGHQIGLDVLLGLELRFPGHWQDFLVYGIGEESLKAHADLLDLGLEKFHALGREEGFLVYQAHPFRPEIRAADPRLLDGVEVYNGNPRHDSRNHLAYRFALEHGLRMVSGSDCHQLEDVGQGGIVTMQRIGGRQELVSALRDGKIEDLIGLDVLRQSKSPS